MSASGSECVLVTGGASGIGAATVERFVAAGARVVIADRRPEAARATADALGADWRELDVADPARVAAVVEDVETTIGAVAVLVNCAGPLQNPQRPTELSMTVWDRVVGVHLRGTYLVTVAVGSRMAKRRRGSIVTVASVMGMRSGPLHAYGPAKAALINLTEGLAAEWGPAGVRVNSVSPGFVTTPGLQRGLDEDVMDAERMNAAVALGRMVRAAEVAEAVYFLASDGASAITGCNLPVDAGYLVAGSWQAYGGLRTPV